MTSHQAEEVTASHNTWSFHSTIKSIMSSPLAEALTPRTLIGKVLGELKTSKPVQRQSKRRRSSTNTSRRQSLNDSTLRKQALLSSANRTEHSITISSNDGETTPRSQIHDFLNAVKTGVPVVRKKRQIDRDEVDHAEEPRSTKRTGHPISFLGTTEETPRTLISNILNTNETGMTGVPVKHRRNIQRSPYARPTKENDSLLQQSGSRSPSSDGSLLDITIYNKGGEQKFGHIPGIRPQPAALVEALSQVNSTSRSLKATGLEDVDITQRLTLSQSRLSLIPETSLDGRKEEGRGEREEDEEEEGGEREEEEQRSEDDEEDNLDLDGAEEEDEEDVDRERDKTVDGRQGESKIGHKGTVDISGVTNRDKFETETIATSSAGDNDDIAAVPDLSAFYKDPSVTVQDPSVTVQNPSVTVQDPSKLNPDPSHSMKEQSGLITDESSVFEHSRTQSRFVMPMEVPKKPRVQLEISFPMIGKQVTTVGPKERTRKPSGLNRGGRSRGSRNTDKAKSAFNLPRSLTKEIFCHFSKCKNVTSGALDEIEKVADQFWQQFTSDVTAFADHAGRISVAEEDVELLMRRQGFVTENRSMYTLVEKYLPLEMREQIIPVAKAGNVVIPKK